MGSLRIKVFSTPTFCKDTRWNPCGAKCLAPLNAQRMLASLGAGDHYKEWLRRATKICFFDSPSTQLPRDVVGILPLGKESSQAERKWQWKFLGVWPVRGWRTWKEAEGNTSLFHGSGGPMLAFSHGSKRRRQELEREAHSRMEIKQEMKATEHFLTHKVQIFS